MAGKPELSAAPGVQNVVVYVSNDNFAQAYTVNHQNVAQNVQHNGEYTNPRHSMAPLATQKGFAEKQTVVESSTYNSQTGYYTNEAVINQNGFAQPVVNNLNYKQAENKIPYIHNEILSDRRTEVQKECSDYITQSNYVVMGGEGTSVRCDSVRSETAESSCSSLSSTDESMLVIQQPEMVVYDNNSVNVRHGVVHPSASASLVCSSSNNQNLQTVIIPNGWKRLLTNGDIIYISPSSTALNSLDQVKEYLLTPGTCKCGLECPLKFDSVFNFDPKIIGKPWALSPATNTGDLTKLCNHKRKILAMASRTCKTLDQGKILKDFADTKKKKRKLCGSYSGISVSQILAQREKMQQPFNKENTANLQFHQQNIWQDNSHPPQQVISEIQQNSAPFFRYQNTDNRLGSPVVLNDIAVQSDSNQNISHQMHQQSNTTSQQPPQIQLQHHQQSEIVPPSSPMFNNQLGIANISNGMVNVVNQSQQKIFINGQPNEPSGPGRPQIIPASTRPEINTRIHQPQFYNQYNYDPNKNIRSFGTCNGYRQHSPSNPVLINQQKMWSHRVPVPSQSPQNGYERVPPLYQHQPLSTVWQDELHRKKVKTNKNLKKRPFVLENSHRNLEGHTPCPNVDVRQISENRIMASQYQNEQNSSPSFLEDPSGYLAQQTALLNNTINRQTGCSNYMSNSPVTSMPNQIINISQTNGVPLPSNIHIKQAQSYNMPQRSQPNLIKNQVSLSQYMVNQGIPDSSAMNQMNCQGCVVEYRQAIDARDKDSRVFSRPSSQPGTPSSSGTIEDPVTSSNYLDKHPSPDSRPIQGGTVSTSNVSPIEGSPDPSLHTPTPPQQEPAQLQTLPNYQEPNQNQQHAFQINQTSQQSNYQKQEMYCQSHRSIPQGIVTTMASGRTVGSNTITSVLAGRANTATVSITNPVNQIPNSSQTTVPISKSPLEMVQSVVSSIKVPQSQQHNILSVQNIPQQMVKGLPPGHIFVSSGGQLIMASSNSGQVMPPPPPPKIVTNQTSMPPISVSQMITNVTASVTQMIPAVAQQVLGQQTVLVNALPTPFVLQPGVTMTMDGMNMQIPHLVTGNVIQQQIQIDNADQRRVTNLLSPENKKKTKKRKVPSQTVASMLHIAAQQNSGVVGFPQQIQMAHSPQGLTTPLMQALTIVPGKAGVPPQIVMNGQLSNAQQLINSQSTQQINLLQPVNLAQGMVQNFPTIQQFVLPNLTGMVMNADGTATIVQEPNIGMQLQLQNVNGQNVLTPVQNNQMFTSGQNIIPAGMVIRPQGKIIQQQHSPGTQFLSPNSGGQFVAQFNGQLSPLVANVSPGQQVTFSPQPIRSSNQQQEYIQCGQTLMVPTNIAASTSNQNTTYVHQNTTIVQQQTTMLSNNQTGQNQSVNVDQNFIISDKQPVQTVVLQQRQQSPMQQIPPNYRHSVSTQTAVNQNGQSVTTNTFCQTSTSSAGSPPDTTTHSPLASGGQSPPTADTTTHSGSTDDGLSPVPSNCSGSCSDVNFQRQNNSTAMVHCISSSEPDSAETTVLAPELDWRHMSTSSGTKMDFTDTRSPSYTLIKKTPTNVAHAESSTMMKFVTDDNKHHQQEGVISSRHNYEKINKRKYGDTLVVMESSHMHSTLLNNDDEERVKDTIKSSHTFLIGDLVWGPARGCPAWPGKLIEVKKDKVVVRWFGDKTISELNMSVLQTLSEGLDAHHRASKKLRTSRKLNTQLEKAIQEAMSELDKVEGDIDESKEVKKDIAVNIIRKSGGRLRSSQR